MAGGFGSILSLEGVWFDHPDIPTPDTINYITKYPPPYQGMQVKGSQYFTFIASSNLIVNLVADEIHYIAIPIPYDIHIDQLSINVTTLKAGGLCVLGIYSTKRAVIDNKLFNSSEIDLSSTGIKTVDANIYLSAGLYFIAIHSNTSIAAVRTLLFNFDNQYLGVNSFGEIEPIYLIQAKSYNSILPTTVGTLTQEDFNTPALIWLRTT